MTLTPVALAFALSLSTPTAEVQGPARAPLPSAPQGGTPEPGTMLLVAGSALGYVVLRRRRRGDVEVDAGQQR